MSGLRDPSSGPSSGISRAESGPRRSLQHAHLPRQCQHGDGERGYGDERHRESQAEPLVGGERRRREDGADEEGGGEQGVPPHRGRAHRRARAEARAGGARPAAADRDREGGGEGRHEAGGEIRGERDAGRDPDGEAELDRDQRGPDDPLGALALDAEGREGRPARSRARELRDARDDENPCQCQANRFGEHPVRIFRGEASRLRSVACRSSPRSRSPRGVSTPHSRGAEVESALAPGMVALKSVEVPLGALAGRRIEGVRRIGKMPVVEFSAGDDDLGQSRRSSST